MLVLLSATNCGSLNTCVCVAQSIKILIEGTTDPRILVMFYMELGTWQGGVCVRLTYEKIVFCE